ncbi:hypothetical protein Pla175_18840 [Pirellulimonas nuda]|uniref:Ice-binding protein C-terminal domain-containing protein n=1 Tax=Pirellulimonas nuda TaxID=2528009 RepID=A0A518DAR0_9BACT|nr:PEP-CTERM sorting domain-containing protein [Pirellulimonas nuda]QDU88506.1 hypothetical protein Pla175_18840 [Pirellulimonas nuda]
MLTRSLVFALMAVETASVASLAQAATVIVDDFSVDSSANYTVVNDGTPDGTQAFAFDYVAAGIPVAPRSAPGSTGGLRLTANDAAAATDAWTLFHNTAVSADKYSLKVDVWMNFDAASGSTEFGHVGVAGNGSTFNSVFTPISGSGAFISFTGDGGSGSDYRWFRDTANSLADDPATAPAISSTTLANSHPSYLGHGSNNTGAFFQSLFPSGTVAGSPGNLWTTLKIDVDNVAKQISFSFDDQLTFQGTFIGNLNGQVSLGLADTFTSVSGASNVFTLYDNLEVSVVPEPASAILALLGVGAVAVVRRRR